MLAASRFQGPNGGRNRLRAPLHASSDSVVALDRYGGMDIIPSLASIEGRFLFDVSFLERQAFSKTKRAMQRIDHVRKVLGPNDRWDLEMRLPHRVYWQWPKP